MAATIIKEKTPLIHSKINKTPVNTDSIEAMTPDKDKKVYGKFLNIEYPGQTAKICCRLYRGMPYFQMTMVDGETYTIPLSVARFINERIHYEPHHFMRDEKGNEIKGQKSMPRYKFIIEGNA